MANLTIPLISIEAAIYNDIYQAIIRDVANTIKVDSKTIKIMYNSMDISKTDTRSNATRLPEHNTPVTLNRNKLEVRVSDDFDDEAIGSSTVNQMDNYPIFADQQVGVYITPVYFNNNISFDFTYTASSKEELNAMRDLIRSHLTRTANLLNHRVLYTLILPEFVDKFIRDVHALKSRLNNEELLEYFLKHNGNRIYTITDMSNKHNAELAIREIQDEVLGYFEMTSNPGQRETDNNKNNHSLNFSYHVAIEIPKELSIRFPIVIANNLMPDEYLIAIQKFNNEFAKDIRDKRRSIGISNTYINSFASQSNAEFIYDTRYPINLPDFDGHYDFSKPIGYGALATILCQIDETDKKTLLNLNELDDYYFPDKLIDYMQNRGRNRVTRMYESFFYFGLDQEGYHFNNDCMILDKDLNLRSTVELDLYKPVRIIVNVCTDINKLTEGALDELVGDDDLFVMFLNEYIELKDVITNTNDVSRLSRINTLTGILIRKIYNLNEATDYERIKEIVNIISRDGMTSYYLGEQLVSVYKNLHEELTHKRILYVNELGYVCLFDPNDTEYEINEKLKSRSKRIDYINNPGLTNAGYNEGNYYSTLDKIDKRLMRTVMTNVVMTNVDKEKTHGIDE